jgi:hypothetical protein
MVDFIDFAPSLIILTLNVLYYLYVQYKFTQLHCLICLTNFQKMK